MKKVFKVVLMAFICFGLIGCSNGDGKDASEDTKKEETKKTEYAIGEVAQAGDIKIVVNSTRIDPGALGPAEDGKVYFVMDITLENVGKEEEQISSMLGFTLSDGDGRKQDLTVGANLNGSMDVTVPVGEKVSGEIAFKTAPEGVLKLTFQPNIGGDKTKIVVR